jgi:hypothetical protein
MSEALKEVRGQSTLSQKMFANDCHLCRLAFLIFLFVFLFLVRCFLLYTSSVLRGALRFQ